MNRVYYLSTCDTCRRLMKEWDLPASFERIDLKTNPIAAEELEQLRSLTDSYESLFNKRSRQLREKGLKAKDLVEKDFKDLILEHYSFLARPVVVSGESIFIGNSNANSEKLQEFLKGFNS